MVVSIAWRSITALCNFAFGILLGGGEMELIFLLLVLLCLLCLGVVCGPIRLAMGRIVFLLGLPAPLRSLVPTRAPLQSRT